MNSITNPSLDANRLMDVREVPCSIKHGLILRTWHELSVGEFFIVRNRHAPERIRQQIEAIYPGALRWECIASEPEDVSVKLTKLSDVAPVGTRESVSCDSR